MRRHPLAQMLTIGAIASAIGVAIVLAMDWFPEQGGSAADDIDTLYDVLLIASVPIFILVMTVAIYSVWRFRARPGDERDGPPIHGNTLLEAVWVTIPFLIVTSLAIYGWVVLNDIEEKQPNTLTVNVTGRQFAWSFEYPAENGAKPVKSNQLYLPKGRPVEFKIRALDVVHSFWVPAFRLKQDAVPGITTEWRTTPTKEGRFDVVCAELCGLGHSTMRQSVNVMPEREFTAWLDKRRGPAGGAAAAGGDQATAGKEVFASAGCNACHTFAPAGSTAKVGPNLDELAKVAGERERGVSPEDYVKTSIVDPDRFVVKGFRAGTMPTDFEQQLTPQEIEALVAFLLGEGGKEGRKQ